MSGLRTLVGTAMARATAGLVMAAMAALVIPVLPRAAADPASDADAAITAAWEADGGATGSLGSKDGGVYPAGVGFGQNFAGGKAYFTPQTGAFVTTPPDLAGQLAGLAIPGDATTAIDAARRAAGGPMGPLGAPDGGQYQR